MGLIVNVEKTRRRVTDVLTETGFHSRTEANVGVVLKGFDSPARIVESSYV